MRKIVTILLLFNCLILFGQSYKTKYGYDFNPVDTMFILTIFVNIHYDLDSTLDPCKDTTPNWLPGTANTINSSWPSYIDDYMDTVYYGPSNINGYFTKRLAASSFNKFIAIGDFMVVDISHSTIKPDTSTFLKPELTYAVFNLINNNGGLQTKYGRDSIFYYDGNYDPVGVFQKKESYYNDKIDFVQIWTRNSTNMYGGVQGGGGYASGPTNIGILINGTMHFVDKISISGAAKNTDLGHPTNIMNDIHEIMHGFLGTNSMHMGGGGPLRGETLVTLSANSGGWSLIGSSGSSLITCNGYERDRLGWHGISASGLDSDIEKSDGNKSFILNDFLTYGDVVRIKLPYVDQGALNQYIWLENHQFLDSRIEYPKRWNEYCRDDAMPGIYIYYQVGKDDNTSTVLDSLHPDFADHLIPICADGNWDISVSSWDSVDFLIHTCANGWPQPIQEYYQENPFCGYNDLIDHYFNNIPMDEMKWNLYRGTVLNKKINGILDTMRLANFGDKYDAFTGTNHLNMSTNPALVNVITYHADWHYTGDIVKNSSLIDNRTIYLTGLKIDIEEVVPGRYRVDVSWNDYNINNDVMWCNNIVLQEKLYLNSGKKITLDQNHTPNQHIRHPVTGLFSGPTTFTCKDTSLLLLKDYSTMELKSLSTLILEAGSNIEIETGAELKLRTGTTLILKDNSNLTIEGTGKIEIEDGAYLCIEEGANITLENLLSRINLREGHNLGVNTDVVEEECECLTENIVNYNVSGSGSIYDHDPDNIYIQNELFSSPNNESGNRIFIGSDVTNNETQGPVEVNNGGELILDAEEFIIIEDEFEVESGGIFEVQE